MIDIAAVRADTPAVARLNHLNNAGAALSPTPVLEATIEHLRAEAELGGYEAHDAHLAALDDFYAGTAQLLGAHSHEIAFTGGASESWWRAFSAVPLAAGDRVLVGRSEFVASALGLMQAMQRGVDVVLVPDDPTGMVDLEAMERLLDDRVKLVCLTHVPMTSSGINPAAEVGALAHSVGAMFLLDACQSVGQMPVDVDALACDFLTATGRKWLRGPRGTGLLYARSTVLDRLNDPVFTDGRAIDWDREMGYRVEPGAQRFEIGERSFATKRGLGVAVRYALDVGLDAIAERARALAHELRLLLTDVPTVTLLDSGTERCAIVPFVVEGIATDEAVAALRAQHINIAGPPARASRHNITSHGVESVLRAAPHYYNESAELLGLQRALTSLR
ncbi:MAG: cysteine desulfurase/selenocysteine lyase [Candidatus Poriferisodalaceae bacterium]|jgi:cysteine desulfurase/selenocysteine lyase